MLILTLLLATLDETAQLRRRATAYVIAHRAELALADSDQLRTEPNPPPGERSFRFQQYRSGVPVDAGSLEIRFDAKGRFSVQDFLVREPLVDPRPRIAAHEALAVARARFPFAEPKLEEPKLRIASRDWLQWRLRKRVAPRARLLWQVTCHLAPLSWDIYVDAHTGKLVADVQTQMCGGPPPLQPE